MAKLELRGVVKRFGANTVCDGIDLDVEAGQMVCLIGASGAGKSTLLRCINLLEPTEDGEIFLDGEDIAVPGLDPQGVRARIGMVFQSFNLFPHMTALENVVEGPIRVKRTAPSEARDRAMALLERVGLADKAQAYPAELSGGERQRGAMARALVNGPDVVLADEPTGNLDTKTGDGILDVLAERHRLGLSMVMVTHDPTIAARADRVVKMVDGVVVEETAST